MIFYVFSENFEFTEILQKFEVWLTTMWKNEKFTVTHKKFRQINSLVFSFEKRYFHEIFVKEVWQ